MHATRRFTSKLISATIAALFVLSSISAVSANGADAATGSEHRVRRAASSRLTQSQRAEFLYEHNRLRKTVQPTAGNMLKMVWNGDLESMAQEWADGCKYEHGQPERTTKPFSAIGQNLFISTGAYDPTKATGAWFNEIQYYNYDTMTCAPNQACGHYTQVAWAKTYAIGCGISFCATLQSSTLQNAHYVVCNYGPAGNYVGEKPYESGAACGNCPASGPVCDDGLCRAEPFCSVVTECQPTNMTYCLCDESYYLSKSGAAKLSAMFIVPMLLLLLHIQLLHN